MKWYTVLILCSVSYDYAYCNLCEPITVPMCRNLPYSTTRFPNRIGHTLQEEAGLEIHRYYPLVRSNCARELREFLCRVYVPDCQRRDGNMRQLCEFARVGCESNLNAHGLQWPEKLRCDHFPFMTEPPPTIRPTPPLELTTTTSTSTTTTTSTTSATTAPIQRSTTQTDEYCSDLPQYSTCSLLRYSKAEYPNFFNHNKAEALEKYQEMVNLTSKIRCSPALDPFLCRTYFPECGNGNGNLVRMRKLCLRARHDCEDILYEYAVDWPEELECERF